MTTSAADAKKARGWVITGTDTGIGKTWAALALIQAFQLRNLRVIGMKPIASGCEMTEQGLVNADALAIQKQCGSKEPYALVNPYAFKSPIAPQIAAERAGIEIDIVRITEAYDQLASRNDVLIVEGAGGWRAPISRQYFLADLVRALKIPVLLVAGLRLGCINHALLTAELIRADGCLLAGWIANTVDPSYGETEETLQILSRHISAPLLGLLPHVSAPNAPDFAQALNLSLLQRPFAEK